MMRVIELDPSRLEYDELRWPGRSGRVVYRHMLFYCSLFEPLPAIGGRVEPGRVIVTRRHCYARIAQNLGRLVIRAVIDPGSDRAAVAALISEGMARELDWSAIDAMERACSTVEQWHVFFFARSLTDSEKVQFEVEVVGVLRDLPRTGFGRHPVDPVRLVHFDGRPSRVAFRVRVPIGDESWYSRYRARAQRFSRTVAPIISFQGIRF